jgi:hypothetical protein
MTLTGNRRVQPAAYPLLRSAPLRLRPRQGVSTSHSGAAHIAFERIKTLGPCCATPEETKQPAVACTTAECAPEDGEHAARAAANMTPGAAAVKAAAQAIKDKMKQRAGCTGSDC